MTRQSISRLLRLPPRGRSGAWLLALGVALVLAIQPNWGDRTAIGVAGALALTLVAAARWQLRWLPVAVIVLCGISLRVSVMGITGSDVADVTGNAINVMLNGDNPYGIGYVTSRPPWSPFPYGPVALLWYLPAVANTAVMELIVSIGLLIFFGVRAAKGRPIGLAIFAIAPPLVLAAMDGSNDTSAGLLILGALVVAAKRPIVGAGILALAVAFKPYAIAWLPPLALWAGVPTLLAFGVVSIVAWSPILFVWGPAAYLKSLVMAQETHLRQAYWSLGAILDGIAPDAVARALETIRYLVSGAVAIVGGRRVRSIDGVIVVGTIVFLIAQFGGYFGSYVYLAAVAPILCWRVDDWFRRGLPELTRAYAEAHGATRRLRHPATLGPNPRQTITPMGATPPRLLHQAGPPRMRTGRPTGNTAS